MAQVWIEYGSESQGHFKTFQKYFEKNKSVSVTGQVGRPSSFEVHVNGQMVHSTLQTRQLPNPQVVTPWITSSSCARGS